MSTEEKPLEINGDVHPPGYDLEEARRRERLKDETGGWRDTEYYPGGMLRMMVQREDGSWQKVTFSTFDDGVIWSDYSTAEMPDDATRLVPIEKYYREHVDTPVFRGEPVTRYVGSSDIKMRGGATTDPQVVKEWVALSHRMKPEDPEDVRPLEEFPDEHLKIDAGVRLLHATNRWAYWSDHTMTPAPDKDEIGDQTAEGNGDFSEAAETLLSKGWKGKKKAFENLADGKQKLVNVEEFTTQILDSLHRRYGFRNHVNHSHSLRKIVVLLDEGLEEIYRVDTIYSGMAPDGFVDENYRYFDEEDEARLDYFESYPARKTRRGEFMRKRRAFRDRHSAIYKYFDEEGEAIDMGEHLFSSVHGDESVTEVRVNRPFVPRPQGAREHLLYGLGHYVVTGENFGKGVARTVGGHYRLTIGINPAEVDGRQSREEEGLSALKARLSSLPEDLDVEIRRLEVPRSDNDWYEIIVPETDARDVGKFLYEEAGPEGWGWTKGLLDESHAPFNTNGKFL